MATVPCACRSMYRREGPSQAQPLTRRTRKTSQAKKVAGEGTLFREAARSVAGEGGGGRGGSRDDACPSLMSCKDVYMAMALMPGQQLRFLIGCCNNADVLCKHGDAKACIMHKGAIRVDLCTPALLPVVDGGCWLMELDR